MMILAINYKPLKSKKMKKTVNKYFDVINVHSDYIRYVDTAILLRDYNDQKCKNTGKKLSAFLVQCMPGDRFFYGYDNTIVTADKNYMIFICKNFNNQ